MTPTAIVSKLWNYCNVLRDDLSACGHVQAGGMSYGDYVEQLTYLLFLKMADERTRPLIQAIVDSVAPKLGETLCDPACGTGGFLLAAHDYVVHHNPNLTKAEKVQLKEGTFKGWELVQSTARLCAMTNRQESRFGRVRARPKGGGPGRAAVSLMLTNPHFTLKTNPLKRSDLDGFVTCYHTANRHDRKPTWSEATLDGRWLAYAYDDLVARDKASLDLFWLRDESLEDSGNLPAPGLLAARLPIKRLPAIARLIHKRPR